MQFTADESVDAPIYRALRKAGYDVFVIVENSPGISDEQVLQIAHSRETVLITQDKDFGELSFRMDKPHHGIILLRLSGLEAARKAEIVVSVVKEHEMDLPYAFTVILADYVKIRKSRGEE